MHAGASSPLALICFFVFAQHIPSLYNYTLYLHTQVHDYDRCRPLYLSLMEYMNQVRTRGCSLFIFQTVCRCSQQLVDAPVAAAPSLYFLVQRGPDNAMVLSAFALYLATTLEEDMNLVESLLERARAADPKGVKFDSSVHGFFRQVRRRAFSVLVNDAVP